MDSQHSNPRNQNNNTSRANKGSSSAKKPSQGSSRGSSRSPQGSSAARRRRAAYEARRRRVMRNRAILAVVVILLVVGIIALIRGISHKRADSGKTGKDSLRAESGAAAGAETALSETSADGAEEQEEDPADLNSSRVNIRMIGDVLLHVPVIKTCVAADGSYDFNGLFDMIRPDIRSTDIAIVNQETMLGGTELGIHGFPNFNSPHEVADALVNTGFDVVLSATNHSADNAEKGISSCLAYWKEHFPETHVLGIHTSQEDADNNVCVIEKNGIRVAILNYTATSNFNNDLLKSESKKYLVDTLWDEAKVEEDVRRAREEADFVIVCPHWGKEYSLELDEDQKHWTPLFLEWGVDLVIGSHPHIIQPLEMLTREDGHQMLVYYSLGNYVSNQENWAGMLGAMADVTIEKHGGKTEIAEYTVHPLVTHKSQSKFYKVFYLDNYTEELAAQNRIKKEDKRFTIERCKERCREMFGDVYQG